MSLEFGTGFSPTRIALTLLALAITLYGLVNGASFLIPLVIAFLASNVVEALIERLERLGLPALIAVPLSVCFILLLVAAFVLIVVSQIDEFIAAWPRYLARMDVLSTSFMAGIGDEYADRLRAQLASMDITQRASTALGSAGSMLLNFSLVLLYVAFLLAERGRIFKRLAALSETAQERNGTISALSAVSDGIRQYLFVKTFLSLVTAALSYAVLRFLGLDFAETWALIIFFLNYIPNIGSILGVVFPAILAIVQFDNFTPFLTIAIGLTLVQFVIGNIIEPMLMGKSLNLSPFTIIVALTFWSSMWGVAGAFLAVPMTAAIVILCREIRGWQWIATLLSNDVKAAQSRSD